MEPTRRSFIKKTAALMATPAFHDLFALQQPARSGPAYRSANDKIVLGLIGVKNMGFGNLANCLKQPGTECGALCDVDQNLLEEKAALVEKETGKRPALYQDFRQLLDNKDIDAVIIGTPDHWHCLQTVYACEAGKDVYVEKPLANSIAECEVMVKAVRKYNRIVQVGQQQRSGPHWQLIMNMLAEGKIGPVRKVKTWGFFNYGASKPRVPDGAVPKGVNYDLWLGPAPERPFNEHRFHGTWRFFWHYGGGLMTDWGVHLLDMALWGLQIKQTPDYAFSTGGIYHYADHAMETADTQTAVYAVNNQLIEWEHVAGVQQGLYNRLYGVAFIGQNGTIVADRNSWEIIPEYDSNGPRMEVLPKQVASDNQHQLHAANFIACMRSRQEPNCPIEAGRLVAMYAQLGNIAYRTGDRVVWDDQKKLFVGKTPANQFIKPAYRKPWTFPKV
jgi:predicted dehydrogenase